jgi:hypothetical protein
MPLTHKPNIGPLPNWVLAYGCPRLGAGSG